MFDIPGEGTDAEAAAALGSIEDELLEEACIAGRQLLFAYNKLFHSDDLFPTRPSGLPNPLSQAPHMPIEQGLRGTTTNAAGATGGAYIFSKLGTKGYEMASPSFEIRGNVRIKITSTGGFHNVIVRGVEFATFGPEQRGVDAADPVGAGAQLAELLNRIEISGVTDWTMTFSQAANGGAGGFTLANGSGLAFEIIVAADADSAWPMFGFPSTTGSATSHAGTEQPAFQNDLLRIRQGAIVKDIDITTVTVGVEIDSGDTRLIRDGYTVAGALQALIRADPDLPSASTFRVSFDGWRDGKTCKFTVSSDEKFLLGLADNYSSGWHSLGFDPTSSFHLTDVATWGVLTQTSDRAAIHTEEALLIQLGPRYLTFDNGRAWLDAIRHLILDTNFYGEISASETDEVNDTRVWENNGPGENKIQISIGATVAALDQVPESSLQEDLYLLKLGVDERLGPLWGTEAAAWAKQVAQTPTTPQFYPPDIFPARCLWVDLGKWRTPADPRVTEPFILIKIVNRSNPAGYLSFGPAFAGPAWRNVWNVKAGAADSPVEWTTIEKTPAGVAWATYREQGRTVAFESDAFTRDEAHILRTIILDARKSDSTQPHALVPDRNLLAAGNRVVWVLNPANRSAFVSSRTKSAGMVRGKIVSFEMQPSERLSQGYHEGKIVIEGSA